MTVVRSVLITVAVAGLLGIGINASGLTVDGPIKPQPGTPTVFEQMAQNPAEVIVVGAAIGVVALLIVAFSTEDRFGGQP